MKNKIITVARVATGLICWFLIYKLYGAFVDPLLADILPSIVRMVLMSMVVPYTLGLGAFLLVTLGMPRENYSATATLKPGVGTIVRYFVIQTGLSFPVMVAVNAALTMAGVESHATSPEQIMTHPVFFFVLLFYENVYVDEYQGKDFAGDDVIRNNLMTFKELQDSLRHQGIDLLLVFEPGKARCMPEYLPRRCRKGAQTNYDSYTRLAKELGVRMLDLNAWFQSIIANEPYPLYSRHGIHWTTYGMWRAADTLQRFIEQECHTTLPSFRHVGDSLSTINKDLDFDLEPPMNLLSELPHEKLCFPVMAPQPVTGSRPRALVIADSYVWSLWDHGILQQWFDQPEFWYYNLSLYPHIWDPTAYYIDKRTLPEVLRRKDVILLMITDANLKDFGWHCVEEIQKTLSLLPHKNTSDE